jgi:hypothetical protein
MERKISEILINAKKLIEKKENWTTMYSARDMNGISVSPRGASAHSFCSIGAIERVCDDFMYGGPQNKATWYLRRAAKSFTTDYTRLMPISSAVGSVSDYNDNHTHVEVMAMWDKAIELALADEKRQEEAQDSPEPQ